MQHSLKIIIIRPICVAISIVVYCVVAYLLRMPTLSTIIALATIFIGAYPFFAEIIRSVLRKQFGLDYIALLAIITAVATQEYLVGSVIVLMLTTGVALENYATLKAKSSLTKLIDRIPNDVLVQDSQHQLTKTSIDDVAVGQHIVIRRGEVISLDGILLSASGFADESSLTGEPYMMEKKAGDIVRSGTVNIGETMHIQVTSERKESTYAKIIALVQQAQDSHAPLVRLADKYSRIFTVITLLLCAAAYVGTGDFSNVLAVLVVATPCPLLLATPIALIGGMNACAKQKIIIKNLASIEVLSRVDAMILDKTGTITLGRPTVTDVSILDPHYTRESVLSIAGAIEHNSLHPIAKAIVIAAKESLAPAVYATEVNEVVGKGISGTVDGNRYTLSKHLSSDHLTIELQKDSAPIAILTLEDEVKIDSKKEIHKLIRSGLAIFMLTGDKKAIADRLAQSIDPAITVQANCTPEDKIARIRELQSQGHITAMVGDGINDAPALAGADVGMVFSNEEQTAASEAASIVFLGGDFSLIMQVLLISKRTIRIAMQSIIIGIGLSVLSMIFAALGWIPPLFGSIWQEVIDVVVIVNALRASR